jgi:hypothetical protein
LLHCNILNVGEDADLAFETRKERSMTKMLFAPAALLLVAVVPAFADEKPTEISFQRDGETYVYTKTAKADRVILDGRFSTGDRFKLTVRGNDVTGTVDGRYVSFSVPQTRAKPDVTAELALR